MKWLQGLLAVGYPFLVFAGLQRLEPRWVALVLVGIFLLRWVGRWRSPSRENLARLMVPALLVGGTLLATIAQNDTRALLMLPVAINGALLLAFGHTLIVPPPLVETLARMQVPDLPADEVRYCRSVTAVWCGFFAANAAVCGLLAWHASTWTWTLYTGLVAYLLVGLLFATEFVVRSWRFGRYQGTLVEPLFRKIFRAPPPA